MPKGTRFDTGAGVREGMREIMNTITGVKVDQRTTMNDVKMQNEQHFILEGIERYLDGARGKKIADGQFKAVFALHPDSVHRIF